MVKTIDFLLMLYYIASSLSIAENEPAAYTFVCGFTIDGIQIDYGIPLYEASWAGRSLTKDRYVLLYGMSEDATLEANAHEWFHTDRRRKELFDWNNLSGEERLAYEFAANESNWDRRILNHKCVVS